MKFGYQIKRFLFACLIALLILPYFQMKLSIVEVAPLSGSIVEEPRPVLNRISWFNESFQNQTEKYLNQNFGFRNWLVRFSNQLKYSLFKTAQANGVIVGKDNYLYEIGYIDSYYGNDFLGNDTIDEMFRKLKVVVDSLKKYNTDLILVFAPGKASFYPEFIPEKYNTERKITNHQYFIEQAEKTGIPYIDFSSWFIELKDTSPYPLYPKTGIHWSYFGVNLAMDSLVTFIEELKGVDLPNMIWDSIVTTEYLYGVDTDIEKGMNLLFPIENHEMSYPKISIDSEDKTKPNTIIVADSYYWQIHNAGYSASVFNNGSFWFYNNEIYTPGAGIVSKTSEIDLRKNLKDSEVIILMATEPTLKAMYWGFIDDCYSVFTKSKQNLVENTYQKQIEEIKTIILKDKNWVEMIKEKARNQNIKFEEMLQKDAEFIYQEELEKKNP